MNKYSILCFFLFVLAVLLFRKKKEMIPRKYLCFLSLVPLLSMLVVNGLLKGRGVAWNLSLLAILVLNVLVYYLMHLLDDYSDGPERKPCENKVRCRRRIMRNCPGLLNKGTGFFMM